MAFEDIIDAALSSNPGYQAAIQGARQKSIWPQQQQAGQLANERAGLINQTLSSNLAEQQRQQDINARAPGELARWYLQAGAQPGTISRPGAMDLSENPEAAGTPAAVSPGQPAVRTMQELLARMPPTEASAPYLPQVAKTLGLITPEAQQQKGTEEEQRQTALEQKQSAATARNEALAALDQDQTISPALKAIARATIAQGGSAKDVISLFQKPEGQNRFLPTPMGIFDIQKEQYIRPDQVSPVDEAQLLKEGYKKSITVDKNGLQSSHWTKPDWTDPAYIKAQKDIAASRTEGRQGAQMLPGDDAIAIAAQRYNETGGSLPPGIGRQPAILKAILDKAAQLDPNASLSSAAQDYKATGGSLAGLTKQRDVIGAFERTASSNADLALSLSPLASRTGVPVFNYWLQKGQMAVAGDPDVTRFNNAVETLAAEYTRVMTAAGPGGMTTDTANRRVQAMLNPAQTVEQFKGNVTLMKQEMDNRMRGYDAQLKEIKGRRPGGATQSPTAGSAAGPVKWGRDANGNPVRLP